VTGGAGTLGAAIGARFARDGADVVLADLDAAAAADQAGGIAGSTGRRAAGWPVDVTDPKSVAALLQRLQDVFGRLDYVVNNAAVSDHSPLGRLSAADWHALMAVNVWGPTALCQAAMPLWKAAGGGRVVNIASRTWLSGGPVAYTTSKAGVVGLTRALAVELAALNVTVNAVAPSMVITPFSRGERTEAEFAAFAERHRKITPLGRLASPQDVANAVAFFASDQAGFVTGEILHVCGGAQLAAAP
jgi:3-oxoacyl-[acyl-carrier protein] reductase